MLAPSPPAANRRRPRPLRTAAVLCAGAAVGAALTLLAGAADRTPPNPHRPVALAATAPVRTVAADSPADAPPATDSFRLATWNIHHGEGTDGATDLDRIAEALAATAFDVALLQEVDGPGGSAGTDQAAALAAALGGEGAFVGTEERWGRTHRGNGVLSRLPTGPLHRVPLPDTRGKGFRLLTLATVRTPAGTPVRVVGVHLSRGPDRAAQLAAAADLFLSLEAPCVLAGDFNTRADDPLLADLKRTPGVTDALAGLPGKRWEVDQIFARGLTATAAVRTATPASDHPLLAVTLTPAGSPASPRRTRRRLARTADAR